MPLIVDLYQKYNPVTDWRALARNVDAAYIKYSNGNGLAQVTADTYVAGCKNAGIPYGGYHFAEWGDAARQADAFVSAYARYGGQLAPALDLESGDIPISARATFARTFLERAHQFFPRVALYASTSWLAALRPDTWPYDWDVTWAAEYNVNDGLRHAIRYYGGNVDLHQFTSNGKRTGASGSVDLSYTDNLSGLLLTGTTHSTLPQLIDDEETNMKLDPGDHRSISFDIPPGATSIRVNCPMDFMTVHGIWQSGDGLPTGTDFDYKWSYEKDFRVDRLRPWKIDVAPGATNGSIIYSYAKDHPERSGSLSFR